MQPSPARIINGLSVDVEDYFQVQALASVYPRSGWDGCESRVERNTQLILDLFSEAAVKATFFTLGWIAERHAGLIRRIADAGHEVASHGFSHVRVDAQSPAEFREDVRRSRGILEDLTGARVRGYRAATFSVGPRTPWAWRVLEEEGYAYSSSVYPVARDFYGSPDAPRKVYRPDGATGLVEIPISTLRLGNRNWPCGGGGYFRLFPYALSKAAIRHVNAAEGASAVFYIHPWELDPQQPRPAGASLKSRLRHYTNLSKTRDRLRRLTQDFSWDRLDRAFLLEGGQH
jgi:polysaccharide deacetylase family protein (PEP-CTERM system associated)